MEIKDILKEVGLSSTAHALPNIIRAKQTWLKIFWTILLILSAIVCFILLIHDISNYFAREVVTKITYTNEISSEFPSIKICADVPNKPLDLSQSFRNLIGYCLFGTKPCNYENDFVLDYENNFGVCFSFNTGKNQTDHRIVPKKISSIGKEFGLRLNIKLAESYLRLRILIYNSSMNWNRFNGDEKEVLNGFETNIILNRLYINKKEYPYCKCISEDDLKTYESNLTKFIFNLGYPYEQKECFEICKNDLINEKSNCNSLYNLVSRRPILTSKKYASNCTGDDYVENWYNFNYERSNEICETRCSLECNSIQYNPVFNNVDTFSDSSQMQINIFYDSLSYIKIEESEKTGWIDLISNIGGTLGLFLGISLISGKFLKFFSLSYLLF